MECRKQRARFDTKGALGELLDAARDAEPVQLAEDERFEDEQVERSLQELRLLGLRYRHSIRENDIPHIECQ